MSLPPEPPPLQDIQSADALYTRVLARGRRLRRERRAFFLTAAMSLVLLAAAVPVALTNDDPAQLATTDSPTTTRKTTTTTTFQYTLEPNPNAVATTTSEVPGPTVAGTTATTRPRATPQRTTRTTARRSTGSSSSASGSGTTARPPSSSQPTSPPSSPPTTRIPSSGAASNCPGSQPALVDHAIAFVRSGDIWVAPIGGGPVQQVTTVGDASKPAWLPNGTSLVFVRPTGLFTVTPGFPPNPLPNTTSGDTDPAYSPDGQHIAFTRGGNIVRMPAGGGSVQVVRNEDATLGTPTWSPDSCDIAFTWKTFVLKARRDGTGVTEVKANASEPSWGSGNRIAVVQTGDVILVNPDGNAPAGLGTGGGRVPTWKPDGSAVAFRLPSGIAYRIVGGDMTTVAGTQAGDTDPAW